VHGCLHQRPAQEAGALPGDGPVPGLPPRGVGGGRQASVAREAPGRGEAADVLYLGKQEEGGVVAQARHGGKEQRPPVPLGPLLHPLCHRLQLGRAGSEQAQEAPQLLAAGWGEGQGLEPLEAPPGEASRQRGAEAEAVASGRGCGP
jgi:hypothetical protein